jgi:hypothetical protein
MVSSAQLNLIVPHPDQLTLHNEGQVVMVCLFLPFLSLHIPNNMLASDYNMEAYSSDDSLPPLENLMTPSKKAKGKMRVNNTGYSRIDGTVDASSDEDAPVSTRPVHSSAVRRRRESVTVISSGEESSSSSDDTSSIRGIARATSSRTPVKREGRASSYMQTRNSSRRSQSLEVIEEPMSRSRRKQEDIMSLDYAPVGDIVVPRPVRQKKYSLRSSQKPDDTPSRATRSSEKKAKKLQELRREVLELGESEKSEDDSSDVEVVQSPTKRRRLERAVKPTPIKLSSKERRELAKDLDYVRSTGILSQHEHQFLLLTIETSRCS